LAIDAGEVLADVPGGGHSELVEEDEITLLGGVLEQGLGKGELGRGDVAPEEDDAPRVLAFALLCPYELLLSTRFHDVVLKAGRVGALGRGMPERVV
jgi:hypothetical protein